MEVMEVASIVSSFVSTILAGFAIWLSLYMFNKGKDTEGDVRESLASIKAQTDALQKLTGKMMDRLTSAVTAPRAADEALVVLMQTIREMPVAIATNLQAPSAGADRQALLVEVLTAYIATLYYAGVANVVTQLHLPPLEDLGGDDPAKRLVDTTCNDFRLLEGYIARFDPGLVTANRLQHLYAEAMQQWKPHVKDSTTVYRDRQAGS
jgi:hypothetical protein